MFDQDISNCLIKFSSKFHSAYPVKTVLMRLNGGWDTASMEAKIAPEKISTRFLGALMLQADSEYLKSDLDSIFRLRMHEILYEMENSEGVGVDYLGPVICEEETPTNASMSSAPVNTTSPDSQELDDLADRAFRAMER